MKRTKSNRVRAVIDTNVWISALVFGGGPGRVILDLRKAPSSPDQMISSGIALSSIDVPTGTSPSDKSFPDRADLPWERGILRKSSIELFVDGEIGVVISEEILSELRRKIIAKFPLYSKHLPLLESAIKTDAQIVELGWLDITVCRDPDDNHVIETAVLGRCDYIVSGDNDLLTVKRYGGIKIVSPSEFLRLENRRNL